LVACVLLTCMGCAGNKPQKISSFFGKKTVKIKLYGENISSKERALQKRCIEEINITRKKSGEPLLEGVDPYNVSKKDIVFNAVKNNVGARALNSTAAYAQGNSSAVSTIIIPLGIATNWLNKSSKAKEQKLRDQFEGCMNLRRSYWMNFTITNTKANNAEYPSNATSWWINMILLTDYSYSKSHNTSFPLIDKIDPVCSADSEYICDDWTRTQQDTNTLFDILTNDWTIKIIEI